MTKIRLSWVLLSLCFLGCCFQLVGQSNNERADTELKLGVDAYKEGKYAQATWHFQLALTADPDSHLARLDLATTFAQQCVPGVKTPENDMYCNSAAAQFQKLLDCDATDIAALKALAAVYFNQQKFDESREYQRKIMSLDPHDPQAPYYIAVLDWTQSYRHRIAVKVQANVKVEDRFITEMGCAQLRAENFSVVEDGMKMLTTALYLKPDYDDAMAYMNLLYRERADIQCGDPSAYDADSKSADKWVKLTMDVRKSKTLAQSQVPQQ